MTSFLHFLDAMASAFAWVFAGAPYLVHHGLSSMPNYKIFVKHYSNINSIYLIFLVANAMSSIMFAQAKLHNDVCANWTPVQSMSIGVSKIMKYMYLLRN